MKVWGIMAVLACCAVPVWGDVRPRERPMPAVAEPIATNVANPQETPVAAPSLPDAAIPGPALDPSLRTTTASGFASYGLRPPARSGNLPRTRWQHKAGNALWTRAAISALKSHGKPLVEMVPGDIDNWCPAYRNAGEAQRRAFWVGFLSALAKHESTYKARAVGGGGRWYGLLQILPATARGYKCNAGSGEGLKSGAANLSCAVRIMARTVPRDGVIHGAGGRGVAADWGPMRNARKRGDMTGWLKKQTYCLPLNAQRPRARP